MLPAGCVVPMVTLAWLPRLLMMPDGLGVLCAVFGVCSGAFGVTSFNLGGTVGETVVFELGVVLGVEAGLEVLGFVGVVVGVVVVG